MKLKITSAIFILLSLSLFSQVAFSPAFPSLTFTAPVFLTHAGDATNRIFVVQQNGFIRVFPNDTNASAYTTFLDLSNKILFGGERGLLGLAFHPNYSSNRYFYVDYTRSGDGATIISRFQTQAGNPNKADSLSELILFTIPQPYSNHNGGMVMFGQDGYLYIGMGDGGLGGDPGNRAQNTMELLGKILRVDVNNPSGGNNYGIPPGNPYNGTNGRQEIFCIGMRNPWRFSQDLVTGKIYCGDVGQDAWEEVDTISVGKNYGWRCYEGNHPYNTSGCGPIGNYTFPIKEYQNIGSDCSITGGYVYRGSRVSWLVGRYVYGDYCSRKVHKLLLSGGVVSDTGQIGTAPSGILSYGVDQNNELYMCCANGVIYKFVNTIIGINGNGGNVPVDFILEQNYPNPFNPTTNIKFSIVNNGFVTLSVYNLTGQEIGNLINENMSPGTYNIEWKPENIPSGVYVYRLTVNGNSLDRKMVLVK